MPDILAKVARGLGVLLMCGVSLNAQANGNNCLFQSKGLFMSFGTLDPSSGRDIVVAVSGANTAGDCAPGQTLTISGDNGRNFNGSRNLRSMSGDLIPYSLIGLPQSRQGPGNGVYARFTFDGAVAWSAYANAPAGAYTDTVIISVSP
jgi:spore coat protein U-like protein